jgi:hypothetical protein
VKRNLEGTADAGSTAFYPSSLAHHSRSSAERVQTLKSIIAAVALQDLIPAAVFEEFLME